MTVTLLNLTDDQLADLYDSGDTETRDAVLAELERQDAAHEAERRRAAWRASPAGQVRQARMDEWMTAAHAEFLAAEEATRGVMLSAAGLATGRDPFPMLWTCSDTEFIRLASEDLRRWRDYDAVTFTRRRDYMLGGWSAREEDYPMDDTEVIDLDPDELAELEALDDDDLGDDAGELEFPTFAADSHDPLPLEWNWRDRFPRGHVVVVAGWRESGKGIMGWNVTAAISNGWPLPGEAGPKEPGAVIGIWDEDDPNEDNAWRARAAGADVSRVYDLTMMPGGTPFELSAARGDMGNIPELLGFIRKLRARELNPRLVILDPLDNLVMNGSIQSKQGACRLIRRLEFVARRTGVTILIFHHLVDDGTKRGKVGGSSKIVDVPRWVYRIERDEDAPELMVLRKHKGNQGDPDAIRYRVVKDGHDSRISWVAKEQYTAEERSWRDNAPAQNRILTRSPQPRSAEQVALEAGLPYGSVRVTLTKLAKRGLAVNVERGLWAAAALSPPQVEQPQVSGLRVISR